MSSIEDVLAAWKQDSVMDEVNLASTITKTPLLHAKYLEYYVMFKRKLATAEAKKNRMAYLKKKYYRGEMTQEELKKHNWDQYQGLKMSSAEFNQQIDIDPDMVEFNHVVAELKTAVSCVEYIMNSIKGREYSLKTLFEYQKYLSGA